MTRIVVDAALFSRLTSVPGPVEICNEQGECAGVLYAAEFVEQRECPLSENELAALDQITEGRTLREIMADLEPSK
jgi:hypothetical protein